ncbi:LysR family transcriptional regulator [Paraburkholderia sediminicola]|uniref:LysR family transcriptional regulator n=1 Tax=Paraburkholderia metrosideri TaxID=580937 RepID=A0ABW9DYT3_9BURK
MRFDIVNLRLFVAIAEAGSITHGAARVNLAVGSASGRMKQMEEAVGVPLLARERLGVRLTDAGLTLLRHARITLASIQRMTDDLDQFAHGLRGTVRLLANTNALTEYLPVPVSHFLASHPSVNIDIEEKKSGEIVGALVEGMADIGIVAATSDLGDLQSFPFATDHLCAIAPASLGDFSHAVAVSFENLLEYDFVGYTRGAAIQTFLDERAQSVHRKIRQRIELGSFDAICRLVENGVGVSIVPESAARRCKRTMSVRVLRLKDDWAVREMRVCVLDRDVMPVYAQQLLEHLIASAERQEQ